MRFPGIRVKRFLALLTVLFLAGCEGPPIQHVPPGVFWREDQLPAIASDGNLCALELGGKPYTYLRSGGYHVLSDALSPDNRFFLMHYGYLGYGTDIEIFLIDLETGAISQLTDNRTEDVIPSWSPDGEWITYYYGGDYLSMGENAGLYRMRRDGSDRELIVAGHVNAHDWSPDGQTLAYLQDRMIWRTSIVDLDERVPMVGSSRGMEWSPDGSMLAFVKKLDEDDVINGQLSLYLVEDSEAHTVLPLPSHIQYFIWSPDGEWIIFYGDLIGTDSDRHYDWYKIRPDGTGLELFTDCDA